MIGPYVVQDCHVCSQPVEYKAGRRRCKACHRWFHARCGMDSNYHSLYAREALCDLCLRENPRKPVRALAKAMNKGASFPALEVILWSLVLGQDEEEMSAKLKIPLPEVQEMGRRLRDQGVWADGKICLDCDDDAKEDELMVCLILAALCAEGKVQRVKSGDQPAYGVRGGGDKT